MLWGWNNPWKTKSNGTENKLDVPGLAPAIQGRSDLGRAVEVWRCGRCFPHENLQATSAAQAAEPLPAQAASPYSLPALSLPYGTSITTLSANICSATLSPDLPKHQGNWELLLGWGERNKDSDTFVLGLWDLTLLSAENHWKAKETPNIKQNKRQIWISRDICWGTTQHTTPEVLWDSTEEFPGCTNNLTNTNQCQCKSQFLPVGLTPWSILLIYDVPNSETFSTFSSVGFVCLFFFFLSNPGLLKSFHGKQRAS